MASTADELAAIRALIDAGDLDEAFARLGVRMRWPAGKQLDELGAWVALLGDLAERRGATVLAEVAGLAVRDPDSPDCLYDLGYTLIDAGAPAIAASVLWRCLELVGDSEEVVCELVSALESARRYADAFAVLDAHVGLRARSFLVSYLYGFNAAMTGRLDVTRTTLAELRPESPETEAMCETLAAIVERAERVAAVTSLDERDLRGWQYVLTGTLLAHRSPYGFDEGMTGRYAWLRDSPARVRTGIDRLVPLARALEIPCIYAPEGRENEIVGEAAAELLGLPRMPWPAVGIPAPGLVLVYDLATLSPSDLARLQERRPDQVLYAHASRWTIDAPLAPDITSVLYQELVPFEGGITEILASPGLDAEETERDDLDGWQALVAATWPPVPGRRARMWAGGPVPSNAFG